MNASGEPFVFIIDDDNDMRSSLELLVRSVGLPAEAFASAEQFLKDYDSGRPGCLVLDVRMPGMGGLELLKHLELKGFHPPVIILTAHGDVPMAIRALTRGAFYFIEKPFNHEELLEQVRHAIARDALHRSERAQRGEVEARLSRLTLREREVLDRLVNGESNKVIARALGISDKTVEVHRKRIMQKMQADSVAELVRMTLGNT